MHAFLRHVFLCQRDGELLCAVVAVVEENNGVAFFDCAVNFGVDNRFDKFVGNVLIIRLLHCLNHICRRFALAVYKQVVGFLDAVPSFVAVHCIETAYD